MGEKKRKKLEKGIAEINALKNERGEKRGWNEQREETKSVK
jgi:hypothetical protein